MSFPQKLFLFLLRVSIGWLFFYAGITKILAPAWSARGFLMGAKTFAGFYAWLASPALLPFVNFINAWGLALIGVALVLGAMVRVAGVLGSAMMLLYYLPGLTFPTIVSQHAFLVDEHIVFIFTLLVLAWWNAGEVWGVGQLFKHLPCCGNRSVAIKGEQNN